MRIVFFGTPEFAATALETLLHSEHDIVGVVTAPDGLGGRGGKNILISPVKKIALDAGIPVLQPEKLKNAGFLEELKSLSADIFIVVAFRMLPEIVWNMPRFGSYNIHGSLLPKYRGAAPIHWAVIRGEKTTGVTLFKLKHEIDTGDIVMQKAIPIGENDTTGDVYEKLKILGAEMLMEALPLLSKEPVFMKQEENLVSHAPKIYHKDAKVNFNVTTRAAYNFIRGMNPLPGAWFTLQGKECKIIQCLPIYGNKEYTPGQIKTDNKKSLEITTNDGAISILQLKPSGSKAMSVHEFLSGNKVTDLSVGD